MRKSAIEAASWPIVANLRAAKGRSLLAWLLLAGVLGAPSGVAAQAQALDTSRAPRIAGAKEIYASPLTTIYSSAGSVAAAADAVGKALVADNWRRYEIPNSAAANNPDVVMMFFKKGPQAMSVLVTLAPNQTEVANVNYGVKPVANNLPVPLDATDVAFDPEKPFLSAFDVQPIAAMLDYFTRELGAAGWAPAPGVKPPATGDKPGDGTHAFFVRADRPPLLLSLLHSADGRTKIELRGVSADLLAAEMGQTKPPPVKVAAAPAPKVEQAPTPVDDAADAMMKDAQKMIDAATAEALTASKGQGSAGAMSKLAGQLSSPAASAPKADGPAETLNALADNPASIPLPDTAEDVDFDGASGSLEFKSASSVKSLATFFRGAMKPLGWREQPSVINKSNMVELDFSKAGKNVSLTLLKMGPKTNVSGSGEGLVNGAARPEAEAAADSSAAPTELVSEESDGFPVPSNHTMSGNEQSPFRHGLTAEVPAGLPAVLAFYRRELGKLGWKEQAQGAVVKPDQALVSFSSPNGPAFLKLVGKGGDTNISLVLRDQDKAAKAGMLPKPGQARIMFGNTAGGEAVVTVNKQTIKVGAGLGAKGPDGPKIDLPPGKYKFSVKLAGRPAKTDEADFGADESWGVLIGENGLLPLQIY
jgi:hypothetical protein